MSLRRNRSLRASARRKQVSKKILIVDDEPNIVAALEFLLQRNGYEVLLAQDGDAALKQVEQHLPDLVLLDVMMPLKSGYEVCQRLRERAGWRHIKIIMLSAKGREAEVNKGLSLGANLYVTKPWSNKDLVAKIGELLESAPEPGGA
jgi:DNA-binding response OmpR family regulator